MYKEQDADKSGQTGGQPREAASADSSGEPKEEAPKTEEAVEGEVVEESKKD